MTTNAAEDGGPVRRTRLPNGLRVVTEAMPELRSVAIGFWAAIDAVSPEDVARVIDRVLAAGPRVIAAMARLTPTSSPAVCR